MTCFYVAEGPVMQTKFFLRGKSVFHLMQGFSQGADKFI